MVTTNYIRDIDVKYLISGPAPLGRILNYIKRIKLKEYKTIKRGPGDKDNLDDWTVCFMVGLGLVKEYDYSFILELTSNGNEVYKSITKLSDFPDNLRRVKPDLLNIKKDIRLKSPKLYNKLREIFLNSMSLKNLAIFFREKNIRNINRQEFYTEYGNDFKITKAGFNRLPSLIQIAEFCDVLVEDRHFIRVYNDKYIYGEEISEETPKEVIKDVIRKDIKRETKDKEIDATDEEILSDLSGTILPERHEAIFSLFIRNRNIVDELKKLYEGNCQICGFTFKKRNGGNYSEAHHLIPLGENGSDKISNIIIVCSNCHSQLHYDNPKLKGFEGDKRKIELNGDEKEIKYNGKHLKHLV